MTKDKRHLPPSTPNQPSIRSTKQRSTTRMSKRSSSALNILTVTLRARGFQNADPGMLHSQNYVALCSRTMSRNDRRSARTCVAFHYGCPILATTDHLAHTTFNHRASVCSRELSSPMRVSRDSTSEAKNPLSHNESSTRGVCDPFLGASLAGVVIQKQYTTVKDSLRLVCHNNHPA